MQGIAMICLDIAQPVFQVRGVNAEGNWPFATSSRALRAGILPEAAMPSRHRSPM